MSTGQARIVEEANREAEVAPRRTLKRRPSGMPATSALARNPTTDPVPPARSVPTVALGSRAMRSRPGARTLPEVTSSPTLAEFPTSASPVPSRSVARRQASTAKAPDESSRAKRHSSHIAFVFGAQIAVVVFALASGAVLDFWYRDKALPGVNVEGVPVGGMAPNSVAAVVGARAGGLIANAVTFTHQSREWQVSAADAGLRIDLSGMGATAVELGRTWAWPLRWFSVLTTPVWRPTVPFRADLDRGALASQIQRIATGIDRPPVEPVLVARNGSVQVSTGRPGDRVDVAASTQSVRLPVSTADRQTVPLTVVQAPPRISSASVIEAQRVAQRILASPMVVRAGDKSWTLSVAQLESMLEFRREVGADGDRIVAGLAEAPVAAFVKTVAQQVDRLPQDGQLRWDGKALTFTKDGIDGLQVEKVSAVRALIDTAAGETREVILPVQVSLANISASRLAALGIKDLVGTGSSKFTGSAPERANNVKIAALKLNHQFVASGETFSFLKALGPITKEEGYLEGLTIQGDATVPGIGGGVCQVSTTLFRAAFYAGLPIVERHQHVYRVSYYEQDGSPVGFDAAVYDPGVDFRFRNDTGSPLLLDASIDPVTSTLVFRLFGETTGREVKLAPTRANEKPAPPPATDVADPKLDFGLRKQVEWKATGVDATIKRSVTVNGKPGIADTFASRYVPWQEKWSIGTGPVTARTPAVVKAAIAQGTVSPGTPGVLAELRAIVSPPPAADGADNERTPSSPGGAPAVSPAPASTRAPVAPAGPEAPTPRP